MRHNHYNEDMSKINGIRSRAFASEFLESNSLNNSTSRFFRRTKSGERGRILFSVILSNLSSQYDFLKSLIERATVISDLKPMLTVLLNFEFTDSHIDEVQSVSPRSIAS